MPLLRYLHYDIPLREMTPAYIGPRDRDGKLIPGKATVAISQKDSHFEVGIALCSPQDNFAKCQGRDWADLRLHQKNSLLYYTVEKNSPSNLFEVGRAAIQQTIQDLYDAKNSSDKLTHFTRWYKWARLGAITPRSRRRGERE